MTVLFRYALLKQTCIVIKNSAIDKVVLFKDKKIQPKVIKGCNIMHLYFAFKGS